MTVNVCLVCLNQFEYENSSISSENNDNPLLLKRFLKFVQNYLQISSDTYEFFPKIAERESFCEKCELAVISPISQVYLEFLSAQLRLSWELGQLVKLLDNSKQSTVSKAEKSTVSNIKLLSLQLGIDRVSGVNEFRNLLTEKCKLKRKEMMPFISLQRCMMPITLNFSKETILPVPQIEKDVKIEKDSLYGDDSDDDGDDLWEPEDLEAHDSDDSLKLHGDSTPVTENSESSSMNEGDKRLIKIKIYHENEDNSEILQTSEEFHIEDDSKFKVTLIKNQENVTCPHCKKQFPYKANLNMHIASKHPDPNKQGTHCKLCSRTFSTPQNLRNHVRNVHEGRPHVCSYCKSRFKMLFHLQEHVATIHKPEPVTCEICGKILKNIKYLKEHMACSHPDPARQQNWPKCPKCNHQFFRKDRLIKHLRICPAADLRTRKIIKAN